MKLIIVALWVIGPLTGHLLAQDKPDLSNPVQRTNYALGLDIAATFQRQGVDIDPRALIAGMADTLAGHPALTPEQKKAAISELSKAMANTAEAERKRIGVQNLLDGEAFLATNARKDGVKRMNVTAPDGTPAELQYMVLKTGAGASPQATDSVEVHYEGRRIDGSVFDSSVQRNTPATFEMSAAMPGWAAALKTMRAGGKVRLFIPPNLAFGETGLPQLGPNCTVVYDLELLSFYAPPAAGVSPISPLSPSK
jgi:FKBP-type peptidyl-prolyl cis-trans isomerase FklB